MTIKFQADADINEDLVSGVARLVPEIDIQTANEARLEGVEDSSVLEIAARENRILLTHDRRTMPYHFADFIASSQCPGVIIVPKVAELGRAIDAIILVWGASDASEYRNQIYSLDRLMS